MNNSQILNVSIRPAGNGYMATIGRAMMTPLLTPTPTSEMVFLTLDELVKYLKENGFGPDAQQPAT